MTPSFYWLYFSSFNLLHTCTPKVGLIVLKNHVLVQCISFLTSWCYAVNIHAFILLFWQEKLQYFRIKELKDVLTQLHLAKQGKKQVQSNKALLSPILFQMYVTLLLFII